MVQKGMYRMSSRISTNNLTSLSSIPGIVHLLIVWLPIFYIQLFLGVTIKTFFTEKSSNYNLSPYSTREKELEKEVTLLRNELNLLKDRFR